VAEIKSKKTFHKSDDWINLIQELNSSTQSTFGLIEEELPPCLLKTLIYPKFLEKDKGESPSGFFQIEAVEWLHSE
jgi:hypothetical protein